jgi:hypothetical protein
LSYLYFHSHALIVPLPSLLQQASVSIVTILLRKDRFRVEFALKIAAPIPCIVPVGVLCTTSLKLSVAFPPPSLALIATSPEMPAVVLDIGMYSTVLEKGTTLTRVRWDLDPRHYNPDFIDWLRARRSAWLSYEPTEIHHKLTIFK